MSTAIYFDLDGTLVEYAPPYGELLVGALRQAGVPDGPSAAEAYTERFFQYLDAFDDDPYRRAMRETLATYDVDADPDSVVQDLQAAEFDAAAVPEGTYDLLDSLAERHTLGVLTNGVPRVQRRKLAEFDLKQYFDAVLVSYELGVRKPDPAAFDAAKERLPADEYAFVGDSLESDVEPAREAGFFAVHVDSGVPRVPDLGALAELSELF